MTQEIRLLVQDDPIFPSVRVNDPHPSRSICGEHTGRKLNSLLVADNHHIADVRTAVNGELFVVG